MIHSTKADADWISTGAAELIHLPTKVPNNAVNLFYHRLCQDLSFRTDFNRGNASSGHQHTVLNYCYRCRYNFTERPVSSARRLANSYVSEIHNSIVIANSFQKFFRFSEPHQIFIELGGDVVA